MITENKALYYEFILDDNFILKKNLTKQSSGTNSLSDYINVLMNYDKSSKKIISFYEHLHDFINEKFNSNGIKLPANNDRAFIITKDENKIQECKEFCHYFVNNRTVFELLMEQVDNETVFKSGLKTVYDTLQLEKELHVNGVLVKKRPKL